MASVPVGATLAAVPEIAEAESNPFEYVGGGPRCYMMEYNGEDWEPWYPAGSTFIVDPDRAPKDDDMVHVEFCSSDSKPFQHVTVYTPRSGHHSNGRFIPPGSPEEIVCTLAPIKFTRAEMGRGVAKILGTVVGVIVGSREPLST